MINQKISVIMFDLGGVLIDCSKFTKLLNWQDITNDIDVLEQKRSDSPIFTQYQLGNINSKQFIEGTIEELELNVNMVRFIREFRLIPKNFYSGADKTLLKLRKKYKVACLSNTNEIHWNKLCDVNKLDKYFDKCFLSHILHMAKPNKDIYLHAVKELGVEPWEILFFDDRKENVETANELGMTAYCTKGFEDVMKCLKILQIL